MVGSFTAIHSGGSLTFIPNGAVQTWIVPNGVSWVTVTCTGGSGADHFSGTGAGGTARGTLAVTAGQIFSIYVGRRGADTAGSRNRGIGIGNGGGGNGNIGPGGSASYVFVDGHLMIGAGGGGGGCTSGGGGGGIGGNGGDCLINYYAGVGGDGYGCKGGAPGYYSDTYATFHGSSAACGSGGGGGGGFLGGAGGSGAGYVNELLTHSSSTVGGNTGDGRVTISW
jgi:hypothetical protein